MARDEKLVHLKVVPLFASLGRRELLRLGQLADEVDVGLGKVLIRQGDRGDEFFVVMDGRVAVEKGGRKVRELSRGEFFGEIALIDGRPRTATVRALGITRLLVLGHRDFRSLMEEFPAIQFKVMQHLAELLRGAEGE